MRAVEYFTLREASDAARALDAEQRERLGRALSEGVGQAWIADTLWAAGQRAEALQHVVRALRVTLEAARSIGPPNDRLEPALEALGMDATLVRRIALAANADPERMAPIDAEMDDAQARSFDSARRAVDALEDALLPRTVTLAQVTERRRTRTIGAVGLVAALLTGALMLRAHLPDPIEVTASAYRTADEVETWPPENIVDRDEMTSWQLPPGVGGWIELRFPTRHVRAIRVLNAHDLHANDRNRADRRRFNYASREIVVTALAGDRELATVHQTLEPLRDFDRIEIPIEVSGVDGIRIDVLAHHGEGAGLAEVEIRK